MFGTIVSLGDRPQLPSLWESGLPDGHGPDAITSTSKPKSIAHYGCSRWPAPAKQSLKKVTRPERLSSLFHNLLRRIRRHNRMYITGCSKESLLTRLEADRSLLPKHHSPLSPPQAPSRPWSKFPPSSEDSLRLVTSKDERTIQNSSASDPSPETSESFSIITTIRAVSFLKSRLCCLAAATLG